MSVRFYTIRSRCIESDSLTDEQAEAVENFLLKDIPNRLSEEYIAYYDKSILDNYWEEASPAVREFLRPPD